MNRPEIYSSDGFVLPLPPGHRFPMRKYALLRERVESQALGRLLVPPAASDEQLALVHTRDYLERVTRGGLSSAELRRLGFPWSPQLVERSRRSTGATVAACRAALRDGVGINLAGGTHHAFADRGEAYCVFNDAAVAARVLQAEAALERVLIVDLDVHQGNGTAAIFEHDPSVYTLSLHGADNFPLHKQRSDLDLALPSGCDDRLYLRTLERGLWQALETARPQLLIYLAGADPYHADRYGRLGLSKDGLEQRDALVVASCRERELPLALAMAGGYAARLEDIVDIHTASVRLAAGLVREPPPGPAGEPEVGLPSGESVLD